MTLVAEPRIISLLLFAFPHPLFLICTFSFFNDRAYADDMYCN